MSHLKREYETLIDPTKPFVPKVVDDEEENAALRISSLLGGLNIDQLKELSSLIQQRINAASKQESDDQTA